MFFNLWRDETAATAIEYSLVASLIAVAAIVGMQNLGTEVLQTFSQVSDTVAEANA
jgi:pilus assembly protein Flp/PilA